MKSDINNVKWQTVASVAKGLAVDHGKVISWIRTGQLKAVNVAEHPGGRPRWRIATTDLDAFLATRQSAPAKEPIPRPRKRDPTVIEFYK